MLFAYRLVGLADFDCLVLNRLVPFYRKTIFLFPMA
jgi:hypothetical protein